MISRRDAVKLGAAGLLAPVISLNAPGSVPSVAQDTGAAVTAWRGNSARTGQMPGPAPTMDKPINIKWVFQHEGYQTGSIVVKDGVVIFGSNDNHVYALDATTGSPKWRFETGGSAAFSSALDDTRVYIPSRDGNLYAIDIETGQEQWRFTESSWGNSTMSTGFGRESAPAVSGGSVFIRLREGLYVIDANSGMERFRFPTGEIGQLSSYVAVGSGLAIVFGESREDKNVNDTIAIDVVTGTERWRQPGSSYPMISNGRAYLSFSRQLAAFDGASGETLWAREFDTGQTLLTESTLVCWGRNNELLALDIDSGEEQWLAHINLEQRPNAGAFAATGSTLYIASDRTLLAIDANTGQELWKAPFTMSLYPESSPPAVVNGTIFIPNNANDDGRIFAIGNPDPTMVLTDTTIRETPSNNARETGTVNAGDELSWVGNIEEHRGQQWIDIRLGQSEGWILFEAVDESTLPDPDAVDFRYWVDPEE